MNPEYLPFTEYQNTIALVIFISQPPCSIENIPLSKKKKSIWIIDDIVKKELSVNRMTVFTFWLDMQDHKEKAYWNFPVNTYEIIECFEYLILLNIFDKEKNIWYYWFYIIQILKISLYSTSAQNISERELPASVFYFHPKLIFLSTKLSYSFHRLPVRKTTKYQGRI